MKASEVLRRYQAGERNFQGVSLRGQSFKGQDLSGANFSEADIRSTNFTGANLTGVNFSGTKCGLQRRWFILLLLLSWLLAGISGFFSILASYSVSLIFATYNLANQISGGVSLIILVVFLILLIRQGIRVVAGAVVGTIAVVFGAARALQLLIRVPFIGSEFAKEGAVAGAIAFASAGTVAGAFTGAVAGALAIAFTDILASAGTGAVAGAIALAIALTGARAGAIFVEAGAVTVTVAVAVAGAGMYVGWRSVKSDERDGWLRSLAIATAAIGGTSFRGADLTEANFTRARLKSTDLRKAILTRVRWYGAKRLERVRPGDTYLKNAQVRQWLMGKGKDHNFDRQILRGINLQGANLQEASFIGAELSEANLQDADLSRAKLVQTQLDGTDLTGATLTGAFIEDWGITLSTILKGVKCEYVFRRLPPEKRPKWLPLPVEESLDPNPRRKPDNWSEVFEAGDFADFIKPLVDTLDLYHNQGVDPRALAIAWQELAENNPEANLRFAAMEVKGENNLLLTSLFKIRNIYRFQGAKPQNLSI